MERLLEDNVGVEKFTSRIVLTLLSHRGQRGHAVNEICLTSNKLESRPEHG
jgi:hypothetical protein